MNNRDQLLLGSIWNKKKEPECCTADGVNTVVKTVTTNTIVDKTAGVYIADTTAGDVTLTIDPSVLGSFPFDVKKKGTDVNNVILSMATGSIYADSGAQPSFSFNSAGAAVSVRLDGTNAYIL